MKLSCKQVAVVFLIFVVGVLLTILLYGALQGAQSPVAKNSSKIDEHLQQRHVTLQGEQSLVIDDSQKIDDKPKQSGCVDNNPHDVPHEIDWVAWERGDLLLTTCEKVDYAPEVGNGYIATVVGNSALFAAGVFNGLANVEIQKGEEEKLSHRAHIPAPLALDLNLTFTDAALDLRRGTYSRHYNVSLAKKNVSVELQFYAHRSHRSLLVVNMKSILEQDDAIPMEVKRKAGYPSIPGFGGNDLKWETKTLKEGSFAEQAIVVFTGFTVVPELPSTPPTKVVVVFPADVEGKKLLRNSGAENAESLAQMHWIAAVRTSLDSADPEKDAKADYLMATRIPHEQLYAEHTEAWAELWASGFEVSGRIDVARSINSSLYYILSSLREDTVYSLSPGGLASNSYSGHTFWDTETWMYPPLVLWHPNLARSLLEYRAARVEQSEEKAKSYGQGYSGAMFAWESALTGAEVCPSWAATGKLEQHITGDIAIALQQFWYATGNVTTLREFYPHLLRKTADFWVSRVNWDKTAKVANIDHVIPPDEYATGDNSVFTNYVAFRNLALADELAHVAGEASNPSWRQVAESIPIFFDKGQGIHPEYYGYEGAKIKQGDVVLLAFPLMMSMAPEVQRNNLEYYASRTDSHGPAMTWAMHAIGYMVLRDQKEASLNFDRSFANTKLPFYVWSENPNDGAKNFITGAGGFLQAVLFGLPGLRILEDHLIIDPWMAAVEGMTAFVARGIHYRDAVFTLSVNSREMTFNVQAGNAISVTEESNETVEIESGQTRSFTVGRIQLRASGSDSASSNSDPLHPFIVDINVQSGASDNDHNPLILLASMVLALIVALSCVWYVVGRCKRQQSARSVEIPEMELCT